MILQKDDFKIQDDYIWISRKAIEKLRQYYKRTSNNAKVDVLTDILKHFEPLEL